MKKKSEEAKKVEEVEGTEAKKLEENEASDEEAEVEVTEEEKKEELDIKAIEEEVEEAEVAEVEEKVEKRARREVEEEIVEERMYVIPLSRAWISPRRKRAPRAMRLIRNFVERHMKMRGGASEEEGEEMGRLVISNDVNEKVWSRGIEKPPRNIRVRVAKDKEGIITVYLAEGD